MTHPLLPYRAQFGSPRPAELASLPLPPEPMPSHQRGRPLKAWRYVGVYGPELMLCIGKVRIGRARQTFWAVWDRAAGRLYERTRLGGSRVVLAPGLAVVRDQNIQVDLRLAETAGIETACASGQSFGWTRKQGGIPAAGTVTIDGHTRAISSHAVIDDTAAYYSRHTQWFWSAGVGTTNDGADVAWNLVQGVNDPAANSERTIWVDGVPAEAQPVPFAPDLSAVGELRFDAEATRERRENLLLVRSEYRQPFGTFTGALPGGIELATGYGVMEAHDVWW